MNRFLDVLILVLCIGLSIFFLAGCVAVLAVLLGPRGAP